MRTQQRQENEQSNKNYHPVRFKTGKLSGQYIRKQTNGNASPIKRREGKQIEDRENDINDERVLQIQYAPLGDCAWQIDSQMKTQGGSDCLQ